MLKRKQECRKNQTIERELFLQRYSRYVSRAHTTFSTLFNIISSIVFGTLGVGISLVETNIIP